MKAASLTRSAVTSRSSLSTRPLRRAAASERASDGSSSTVRLLTPVSHTTTGWVVTAPSDDQLATMRGQLRLASGAPVPLEIEASYRGGALRATKTVWLGGAATAIVLFSFLGLLWSKECLKSKKNSDAQAGASPLDVPTIAGTSSAHGMVTADPFMRTTTVFGWAALTAATNRLCPGGKSSEARSKPSDS